MDISVSDAPAGRLIDGRYRVDSLLARGGMATVYLATDTRLERTVALKVMHAELAADDDFVARFISEARSTARLTDPHVVSVFDQGEDEGAVFLAMEYVEGRTLRDMLNEQGRLQPAFALEILESVLSALRAAHEADIVHRDVKPENVLISDDGRVKVTDFGVARAPRGPNTTARGLLLGTVNYISPEQALGHQATPCSDVYAAGTMLYELLTGSPPHTGATDFVVVRAHIDEDVPPPSESVPVPAVVDDLVATATARDPDSRYSDAGTFLAAVRFARTAVTKGAVPARAGRHASRPTPTSTPPPPPPPPGSDAAGAASGSVPAAPDDLVEQLPGHGPDADADPAVNGHGPAQRGEDALSPIDVATAFYHDQPLADEAGSSAQAAPMPPKTNRTRVISPVPDELEDTSHDSESPDADSPEARRSARRQRQRQGRSWRGPLVFALVVLVTAAVTIAAWWFGAGRWTSTPALINLEPEEAIAAAEEAGLNASADGEAYSESVEPGLVVDTEPAPGEEILRGDTITLIISQGPERYEVPDITGMRKDQAQQALEDRNLAVSFTEEHHAEVEEGQVISQDYEPGEEVRPDTEIAATLSLGPKPIELDDHTGSSLDEATAALEDAGLQVESSEEFHDEVAPGVVISQEPQGGSTVHEGDTISLTVSKGPEIVKVKVPDVVGESPQDAERRLAEAGFAVEIDRVFPRADWLYRPTVERQEPDGGTMAPQGSTVTIHVR
ncbi:serine/threonine protein kinase [Actinobacteria bacterium YIM 96077]|uniref:non-specific serine/threonine protein kinase n=1 Tax=Phytoactinopolyspora halophila TaxID=1981511 RepID=A0A329QL04_9ACTN|nr:Stk1 family PASTA domain-containing Ser/Thr kinase [Phytoactinopolyspora halophila]AYY13644.1 serine/threonine protein kinase [Actinobacteria bacterium YIM 96077]RAW11208.1 serine/threonine protein kinase [Phytoactinopolyspora halophila]